MAFTALPELVVNKKTRTGNEVFIYYNLGQATFLGRAVKTTAASLWVPEESCAGGVITVPVGGFSAVRAATPPAGATDIVATKAPDTATVFKDSPVGASYGLSDTVTALDEIVLTGGAAGDTVDLVALPDPDNDILICYDQGFEANPGTDIRAIPRKLNPVDHYVKQRPENRLSLSELTVNNWHGLRRISGRDVTLIVKIFPDGIGVPTEIQYYTNVRFTVPFSSPAESNDSVTISAEGSFDRQLIFAARPV